MASLLPPGAAAFATAARRYGVLTWYQAHEAGLTKTGIRRFMRAGDRRRPYPRVYAVRSLVDLADPTLRLRTTVMAAQLALGGDAFAGGETAARLWGVEGLSAWDHHTVHMVLPGRGSHRHVPGITLHSWKTLPTEVTRLDGGALRVTTPVRTLADTLLGVDRETAVCLMDSAFHRGLVTPDHIPEMERANRGRR